MAKKKAEILRKACVACGVCVKNCPLKAVSVYKGMYARIDEGKCVGCGKCAMACPANIITIVERKGNNAVIQHDEVVATTHKGSVASCCCNEDSIHAEASAIGDASEVVATVDCECPDCCGCGGNETEKVALTIDDGGNADEQK